MRSGSRRRMIGHMDQSGRGLFGRERELAEADVALAAAADGTPQALLLGGDAGIGKTSFVGVVSARAAALGFSVLTGHCLDIETGEPLAPLREALRGALAGRRPETLPPVARRLEPYVSGAAKGVESGLVEALRLVVGELADEGPVLLVLEDMHWADASTRDIALALARTMVGPVLLLLTYRADDLVRRHPFRKTLVDVGRVVGAHRLDLAPLDRDGIAGIVARATGASEHSVVGTLLARSEGNPLYAEELLGQDLRGVPVGLNDLLLARVERLGGAARSLVRLASVNGSRVDTALLRRVSRLTDAEVDACVREAVDANVLRCTDDHVDFRHGLLREAVYDDLLPGERNRAHAELAIELATELAAMPPSGDAVGTLTRLAYHWDAANDQPQAFAARLRAGVALARRGHPEALAHLERALEMWDHVDDPALRDGLTKADVLCHLATAAKVVDGDEDRAVRFIREAIRQLDPDGDRLLASRVYVAYAELCHELADELGHREAVSRALELAEGAPSEELVHALMAMSTHHARHDELGPAAAELDRAVQVATEAGSAMVLAEAQVMQAGMSFDRGRLREAWSRLDGAAEAAERAGLTMLALETGALRAFSLLVVGRIEEGERLAAATRDRATALGLADAAAFAGEQLVELWANRGRFDDAELLLEEMRPSMRVHRWRSQRIWLLLARGDFAAAEPLENEQLAIWAEVVADPDGVTIQRMVELYAGLGRPEAALEAVAGYLATPKGDGNLVENAFAARGALTALALAARTGTPVPGELRDSCLAFLDETAAVIRDGDLRDSWPASDVRYALATAADLAGEPSIPRWREAVASASAYGVSHALSFGLGLAAALLAAGERDEARVLVLDVWQSARDLGARGVEAEAARLARRNRITLPEGGHRRDALAVLTEREREVLGVLATGATNRVIAERLFISEKTVSVHVTNILAKLGVPNRGAAAAVAREAAGSPI